MRQVQDKSGTCKVRERKALPLQLSRIIFWQKIVMLTKEGSFLVLCSPPQCRCARKIKSKGSSVELVQLDSQQIATSYFYAASHTVCPNSRFYWPFFMCMLKLLLRWAQVRQNQRGASGAHLGKWMTRTAFGFSDCPLELAGVGGKSSVIHEKKVPGGKDIGGISLIWVCSPFWTMPRRCRKVCVFQFEYGHQHTQMHTGVSFLRNLALASGDAHTLHWHTLTGISFINPLWMWSYCSPLDRPTNWVNKDAVTVLTNK